MTKIDVVSCNTGSSSNTNNTNNTTRKTMSSNNNINKVERHVWTFANAQNALTYPNMKKGHDCQGISKGVGLKLRAINNMLDERSLPHTTEGICSLENPARTGIWNKDGTFNEAVFNEVTKKAHIVGDKRVMTKQIVVDYLKEKHKKKSIGNACNVFYVVPVNWTRVTSGSIDELFEYYSNCWYNGEKAMTVERMKHFYTNPRGIAQERKNYIKGKGAGSEIFL